MGKKISVAVLIIACIAFVIVFHKYAKESGLFRSYPDAGFLSEAESASRPVYKQMSKKEKAVYEALYRGISEMQEDIPLPEEVNGDLYSKVYCILEKQEGQFFYLDSTYYTAQKVRDAKVVYRTVADVEKMTAELQREIKKAVDGSAGVADGYSKVRYINDYIVSRCRYTIGADSKYASTAYGCLVEGKANCEGYAKAFDMIAAEMGLESVLITGVTYTGENHAWNQVRIGPDWYNLDVTWADTDVAGDIRRAYLLCNDKDFSVTHIPDTSLFKPFPCTSDQWNYYVRNGLYADSLEAAENILRHELTLGNRSVDLKFADDRLYYRFKSNYIDLQAIFDIMMECGYSSDGEMSVSLKENELERCMTLIFS